MFLVKHWRAIVAALILVSLCLLFSWRPYVALGFACLIALPFALWLIKAGLAWLRSVRRRCYSCEKRKFVCFMYKGGGRCKKCVYGAASLVAVR